MKTNRGTWRCLYVNQTGERMEGIGFADISLTRMIDIQDIEERFIDLIKHHSHALSKDYATWLVESRKSKSNKNPHDIDERALSYFSIRSIEAKYPFESIESTIDNRSACCFLLFSILAVASVDKGRLVAIEDLVVYLEWFSTCTPSDIPQILVEWIPEPGGKWCRDTQSWSIDFSTESICFSGKWCLRSVG